MPSDRRKVARLRLLARAAGVSLTDDQIARLSNIDFLVDSVDEEVDTLLDELGIADPDEQGEPEEPGMASSPRAASLRMAIRSTRDRTIRARLQAQYRELPVLERRELLTAELVDERACRRVVRVVSRARRETAAPADPNTLYGHFAVFDTWTEVDSMWEGTFMESIAPGAFMKTIAADRELMRITLNHGRDPMLGNKVLAYPINTLREDAVGAYYEAPLLAGVDPLVVNGLRAGAYGASFRFYVNAENVNNKPEASDYNPRALPERTITEAAVEEFGPVTFPQYPEASAQLRSQVQRARTHPAAAPAASLRSRSREEWLLSLS